MDAEGLAELFEAFGPVRVRRMFGGHGLYADGLMFGLATQDVVWIKTDAENRPAFEAAACRPFAYRRGERVVELSYWSVPEAAMDDPEDLAGWARLGLEAARRSAAEPHRAKARKSPPSKSPPSESPSSKSPPSKSAARRKTAASAI